MAIGFFRVGLCKLCLLPLLTRCRVGDPRHRAVISERVDVDIDVRLSVLSDRGLWNVELRMPRRRLCDLCPLNNAAHSELVIGRKYVSVNIPLARLIVFALF